MLVVMDFDDTVFDRVKNKECLIKIFESSGVDRQLFSNTYVKTQMLLGKAYNFDKHLSLLPAEIDRRPIREKFNRIYAAKLKDFVFPDAWNLIKKIRRDPASKIALLSFGDKDFQMFKIRGSGLAGSFDKIVVTEKPKVEEFPGILQEFDVRSGGAVFYIDDIGEEIDLVKRAFPFVTIFQVKRDEERFRKHRSSLADFFINNLEEAYENIEN